MAGQRGHVEERTRQRPRAAGARQGWRRRIAPTILAATFMLDCAAAQATNGPPDWDQVANIKDAAVRLAQLQRTRGATHAFAFIDACYRTHKLSSHYTKAFEACIAQDYLETQILALIYSRLPPETLKKMGAPSVQMLAQSMGKRVSAAFESYDVPPVRVAAFKKLVDEHGFPVFFQALFPDTKVPVPKDLLPKQKK